MTQCCPECDKPLELSKDFHNMFDNLRLPSSVLKCIAEYKFKMYVCHKCHGTHYLVVNDSIWEYIALEGWKKVKKLKEKVVFT